MTNKITIIGAILALLIIIGLMVSIRDLNSNIDVLEGSKSTMRETIMVYEKFLDEKDEIIYQLQNKNYEQMELIKERNMYFEKLINELESFTNKFDSALITRYAPLDPLAVEGMCFQGDPSVTATGMQTAPNIIAVDPKRIPYGSKILIEGFDKVFTAGDTGSAMRNAEGLLIDVFAHTRQEAFQFGKQERKIIILE